MIVCVPVTPDGLVDPRWGRAERVAVAEVRDGRVATWREFEVRWDRSHDAQQEGDHHARVARFLRDHGVRMVVAQHMGDGMRHMLAHMGIAVRPGSQGRARSAALAAVGGEDRTIS